MKNRLQSKTLNKQTKNAFSLKKVIEVENMVKKAVISISLVEESVQVANKDIEKEILNELSNEIPTIPWFKEIEKVKVTEDENAV